MGEMDCGHAETDDNDVTWCTINNETCETNENNDGCPNCDCDWCKD